MRIERIVITGDVFRTANGDANQLANVRWLRGELARVLHDLTGLWPAIRYRRNAADDGRAVIGEWYRLLGHAPSLEAWAATFGLTEPPDALAEALRPDYDRALVIGFELSPLMRAALERIGAPWIDVGIAPVRFLDDLALSLRFSWPVEVAHPGLVSDNHVRGAVARLGARHGSGAAAADLCGACVFLAQTRHDRTLIVDGGFFADNEAARRVAGSLDGRALVLKPHPLAPDAPLLALLQQRCAARTTEAGIYAILAAARDTQFLTISSSAAIEARHFGHRAEMFHPAAQADAGTTMSLWAHRSAAFWRAVLAPVLPVRAGAVFEERTVPDRLRRLLGWWGMVPANRAGANSGKFLALPARKAAVAPQHGPTWDMEDETSRRVALGVPGNDPSDFDAIVASRHARRDEIVERLALRRTDRTLDLGSGMGLLAEVVAPHVARIHCADISETYLADCRKRLAAVGNVEFHKIAYGDLSPLYDRGITKAYATLLFIHFNFYDFLFYLSELNRVLEPSGLLYFDYNDGDRFSLAERSDSFLKHIALYKENREHWVFGCMHMGSHAVLKNLVPQLGFRIASSWPSSTVYSRLLLQKVGSTLLPT